MFYWFSFGSVDLTPSIQNHVSSGYAFKYFNCVLVIVFWRNLYNKKEYY